jgi:CheY-like chemotaxis protein
VARSLDPSGRTGAAGLEVLVVDDHEIARRLAETMLEAFGAEATMATCAEEAVEQADRHAFDVALIDFGLPDRDGLDLALDLATRPGTRGAALIAVTGRARPALLPSVLAGWLEKPYSVRDLHAAVTKARAFRHAS